MLERTPAILRDTLTFPYTTGLTYVQAAQTAGGWPAVDAFFKTMPESTEQILHPDKYTAHETPVKVELPADLATRLGCRLDGPDPGHVRRVPAGPLAP